MRYFIQLAAVVGCILGAAAASPAVAERRLALAVGIDAYDHLPALEQLQKAVNDARAVGTALKELGFDTTVEENLPRLAFIRAWQKFLNRLEPGDTAALFFAGHGVEVGGLNYLLPRDVPRVGPGEDQVLAEGAIRFNTLMENLRDRKVRVSLLIIDACRDNPFRDGAGRSVGGTRGLTRVEPPEGAFVMYSAGVGEQALDRLPGGDPSPNSVYTRVLLPILKVPGLSLPEIAGRVRAEVVNVARGAGRKQTPAYYDQLVGTFLLKPGSAADAKPPVLLPPSPSSGAGETARICREVEGMRSLATLSVLERQHKGSTAGECVAARIRELTRNQNAGLSTPAPMPSPTGTSPAVFGALAGTWKGNYRYFRGQVDFVVALETADGVCRGRAEEPNTFSRQPPKLFADVSCHLMVGSGVPKVVMRKVYDGTGGFTHAVDYSGELSVDGRTMTGTWTLSDGSKGPFTLRKQ